MNMNLRIVSIFLGLVIGQCLLTGAAPPILRQPFTTNAHFGPLPTEGQVPIWNATASKWSNSIPSGGGGVGFGDLIWTNDNLTIKPNGLGDNTNPILIGPTGRLLLGPNTPDGWAEGAKDGIIFLHDPQNGDDAQLQIAFSTVHDVNDYSVYSEWTLLTETNSLIQKIDLASAAGSDRIQTSVTAGEPKTEWTTTIGGYVLISPGSAGGGSGLAPFIFRSTPIANDQPLLELQNGPSGGGFGTNKFTVSASGVTTNYSNFYALGPVTAPTYTVVGTTNQIIFGATNIAPASAIVPTHWISVQVSGNSAVFRLPLYQ